MNPGPQAQTSMMAWLRRLDHITLLSIVVLTTIAQLVITVFFPFDWVITLSLGMSLLALIVWGVVYWIAYRPNDVTGLIQRDTPWSPTAAQIRLISMAVLALAFLIIVAALLYSPGQAQRAHREVEYTTVNAGDVAIDVIYPTKLVYTGNSVARPVLLVFPSTSVKAAAGCPTATPVASVISTATPVASVISTATPVTPTLTSTSETSTAVSATVTPTVTPCLSSTVPISRSVIVLLDAPGRITTLNSELKPAPPRALLSSKLDLRQQQIWVQPIAGSDKPGEAITLNIVIADARTPDQEVKAEPPLTIQTESEWDMMLRSFNTRILGDAGVVLGIVLTIIGLALELRKSAKETIDQENKESNEHKETEFKNHLQHIRDIPSPPLVDAMIALYRLNQERNKYKHLPNHLLDAEERVKGQISGALGGAALRSTLREIGRRLYEGQDVAELELMPVLQFYDTTKRIFEDLHEDLHEEKPEPNLHLQKILAFFGNYDEDGRDICVYYINKHGYQLNSKEISGNSSIFADSRIIHRSFELHRIFAPTIRAKGSIEETKNNLPTSQLNPKKDIVPYMLRDTGISNQQLLDLFDVSKIRESTALDQSIKEGLARKQHIAIVDELLYWGWDDFEKSLPALQQTYKAWTFFVLPSHIHRPEEANGSRMKELIDIAWALAENWAQFLAVDPMGLFALSEPEQIELSRLMMWRFGTTTLLRIEFEARSATELVKERKEREFSSVQRRLDELYRQSTLSSRPLLQEILGWLRLKPYGCKQTWMYIINTPRFTTADDTYLKNLNPMLAHFTDMQIWVRVIAQSGCGSVFGSEPITETDEHLEKHLKEQLSRVFKAPFEQLLKRGQEAKPILDTIFHRANGSFASVLKQLYDACERAAKRSAQETSSSGPRTRSSARDAFLVASDFE